MVPVEDAAGGPCRLQARRTASPVRVQVRGRGGSAGLAGQAGPPPCRSSALDLLCWDCPPCMPVVLADSWQTDDLADLDWVHTVGQASAMPCAAAQLPGCLQVGHAICATMTPGHDPVQKVRAPFCTKQEAGSHQALHRAAPPPCMHAPPRSPAAVRRRPHPRPGAGRACQLTGAEPVQLTPQARCCRSP